MKETYLHFSCRKCQHQIFISHSKGWVKKLMDQDGCPNCGEEPFENWLFVSEEPKKSVDKRFGW